jgi:hypothetical protein
MRSLALSFVALTAAAAMPAVAQPVSHRASNIQGMPIHSTIAPQLPAVGLPPGSSPTRYLEAARRALSAHQTGRAQQALESAETRWLTRSVPAGAQQTPYGGPVVQNIRAARQALGQNDIQRALSLVQQTIPMTQQAEAAPMEASPVAGQAAKP